MKSTLVLAVALLSGVQALPQCSGQSCFIGYISGASKSTYKLPSDRTKAEGQNPKGEKCVRDYLGKLNVPIPAAYATRAAIRMLLPDAEDTIVEPQTVPALVEREVDSQEHVEEADQAGCKDKTILWARGTYESGEFGQLAGIGPGVQKAFSSAGWGTIGLKKEDGYDAAADNNYCVGLPGGYACIPWLNKQVARCPKTKFILGGYSQGAMVSRICVAFANDAAKKAVKGLLLFGDPMNGADNKGIDSGKIKTFCESGDGVCRGEFKVSGAHLAYSKNINSGVSWAQSIINS